jgi:uncharacterized membrane protein
MQLSFPYQYTSMLPDFLPYRHEWVTLSGIFLMIGGAGIIIPRVRRESAIGLLILLFLLFPLYVQALIDQTPGLMGRTWEPWFCYSRLVVHPLLMFFVWYTTLHPVARTKKTHW